MKIPHDYKHIDTSPKPSRFELQARFVLEFLMFACIVAAFGFAFLVLCSFG